MHYVQRNTCHKARSKSVLACYVATFPAFEHGYIVPSIETLEKMSRALEVPLYQLFYEGDSTPARPKAVGKAPSWVNPGRRLAS